MNKKSKTEIEVESKIGESTLEIENFPNDMEIMTHFIQNFSFYFIRFLSLGMIILLPGSFMICASQSLTQKFNKTEYNSLYAL